MTELKAKKWRRAVVFFISASFIVCIFLILNCTVFSKTKGISSKDTVFLNPKYSDSLSQIYLCENNSDIMLYKKDSVWWGKTNKDGHSITFPLNKQKISSFISTLSSIRKIYHISDNVSLYKDYKLDENAFFAEARDANESILFDLYIGNENYNGTKIAFRTGKSTAIYETEENLKIFLHSDAQSWADMQLIPPELCLFEEAEVMRCSIDRNPVFESNRTDFEEYIHKLKNSRGSVVLSPEESNIAEQPAHEILLETPADIIRLIFSKNISDETFAVQCEINGKLLNYALEISQWTFNNIFSF